MGNISTIGMERVQKPPAQSAAESKRLEVRLKVFPFRCSRFAKHERLAAGRRLTWGALPQMAQIFSDVFVSVLFIITYFFRVSGSLEYEFFWFLLFDDRIANRVVDSSVSIRFRVMALSDESKCVFYILEFFHFGGGFPCSMLVGWFPSSTRDTIRTYCITRENTRAAY